MNYCSLRIITTEFTEHTEKKFSVLSVYSVVNLRSPNHVNADDAHRRQECYAQHARGLAAARCGDIIVQYHHYSVHAVRRGDQEQRAGRSEEHTSELQSPTNLV